MIHRIQNECLSVAVDELGAQVLSVRGRTGTEYMWQREPDIWPRTAPVLFPVIGRLRNNAYSLHGRTYAMPRHGFARQSAFRVTESTEKTLALSASSNEETIACYPFDFTLEIRFELDGARLVKTHTVVNRSSENMLFELGGHDGFRVALEAGETMSDYYILFEGETALKPLLKGADMLFSGNHGTLPLDEGRLWLSMELFRSDALVLDRLHSRRVQLCNASGSRRLGFSFPDFPILAIWTPDKPFDTNFVCLEAWTSLPDSETAGPELSSKIGICRLSPGEKRHFCYTTEFLLSGN
ncbi:MAG: aldose 1-epimerase family protein [Oscillospiraceae bacterium]|nr:aldose 1-epimerase family protein [Oscillospiraceae bacterium]